MASYKQPAQANRFRREPRSRLASFEPDVVDACVQRALIVGRGEAQPDCLACPRRQVERHLSRWETRWIARMRLKDIGEHVLLGHRVHRRRRGDKVDPVLRFVADGVPA